MCYITFPLHAYDLTFIPAGGGNGGGATGEKAARLMRFQYLLRDTTGYLNRDNGTISIHACGNKY